METYNNYSSSYFIQNTWYFVTVVGHKVSSDRKPQQ